MSPLLPTRAWAKTVKLPETAGPSFISAILCAPHLHFAHYLLYVPSFLYPLANNLFAPKISFAFSSREVDASYYFNKKYHIEKLLFHFTMRGRGVFQISIINTFSVMLLASLDGYILAQCHKQFWHLFAPLYASDMQHEHRLRPHLT